ncbi:MAG TPA: hypothetical protein VEA40_17910 [Ramlibacter sp.]|nr:hypothetical protein [Ramlibacter sp.]
MNSIKSRIAALVLAGIGGSAFAGVIQPIATSADGGYTAVGAHAMGTQAPTATSTTTTSMGAAPAMTRAETRVDLFRSADGSPMALAGSWK